LYRVLRGEPSNSAFVRPAPCLEVDPPPPTLLRQAQPEIRFHGLMKDLPLEFQIALETPGFEGPVFERGVNRAARLGRVGAIPETAAPCQLRDILERLRDPFFTPPT